MYGCDTMMMGGEPIEKSNEDDTSIWGIYVLSAIFGNF